MGLWQDIGGLGGVGSALSAATGIAGLFQNRKNAKFARKMAEKNYLMQKEAQRLQQENWRAEFNNSKYQFDQLNNPSIRREKLEEAGFNPFMDQSQVNSSSPTSMPSSNVLTPQYDVSSVLQSEQLRQSNISSTVGSIKSLLEGINLLGTIDSSRVSSGVKARVDEATENAAKEIVDNQRRIGAAEAGMAEIKHLNFPRELNASINNLLMQNRLLDEQAVYYNSKNGLIEYEKREKDRYCKMLDQQILLLIEQTTGQKADNKMKQAVANLSDSFANYQLEELKSNVAKNYASAKQSLTQADLNEATTRLTNTNNFWAGMPKDYSQFVYKNSPGTLGDILYNLYMNGVEVQSSIAAANRLNAASKAREVDIKANGLHGWLPDFQDMYYNRGRGQGSSRRAYYRTNYKKPH